MHSSEVTDLPMCAAAGESHFRSSLTGVQAVRDAGPTGPYPGIGAVVERRAGRISAVRRSSENADGALAYVLPALRLENMTLFLTSTSCGGKLQRRRRFFIYWCSSRTIADAAHPVPTWARRKCVKRALWGQKSF